MQVLVVREALEALQPDGLVRHLVTARVQVHGRVDVAHVEGAALRPVLRGGVVDGAEDVGGARQGLRGGHVDGHGRLVLEPGVVVLEARDHRQDRAAVLIGLRAARRERAAVVDAVDRERDRLVDVAGPQEVAVHGVDEPVGLDRAHGREHGLGHDLAAEHAPLRRPQARRGEDVLARARPRVGEREGGEEVGDGVARRISHPS